MPRSAVSSSMPFPSAVAPAAADEPVPRLPLVYTVAIAGTGSFVLWTLIVLGVRWMFG